MIKKMLPKLCSRLLIQANIETKNVLASNASIRLRCNDQEFHSLDRSPQRYLKPRGGKTRELEDKAAEIECYAMMVKWGWENFVANVNHCIKGIKREAHIWPILSTIFLLFLIRIVYLAALERESMQPFFGSLSVFSGITQPSIKGTSIVGSEGVQNFRNYLDCFSESGRWVYDPTPRHIPWNYVGDPYTDVCEERHEWLAKSSGYDHVFGDLAEDIAMGNAAGNWSVREDLKWVWQTNSSCPWRSIDRDQFCRKIGDKGNVMVVGDSINHAISWSLMNALIINGSGNYQRQDRRSRFVIGPYEMCSDIYGNGRGFNISYICNAHLSNVTTVPDNEPESMDYPWIDFLDAFDTKILFLNKGAHYEWDEILSETLRNVFTTLTERYPDLHVIFRNTPPGHMDCTTFNAPLVSPQNEFIGLREHFHWGDFSRQNLITRKIVEEFGYTYMDVSTMISLRPEAHISHEDCLHYCVPGPLDIAVEYLYNILLIL